MEWAWIDQRRYLFSTYIPNRLLYKVLTFFYSYIRIFIREIIYTETNKKERGREKPKTEPWDPPSFAGRDPLGETEMGEKGFPGGPVVKNPPASAGGMGSVAGLGRPHGNRNGYPFQHSCLENSHGQKSLEGCSPWGRKESDTSEWLSMHAHAVTEVQRKLEPRNLWCCKTEK